MLLPAWYLKIVLSIRMSLQTAYLLDGCDTKERKQDIILDSFVTAKKEHTTTTSREEIQFVPSDGVADIDHLLEQMGLPICNPEATKSNCKALMIESSIGADYSDYDLPEDIAHCKTLMIESSIGADYYEVPVEVPPVVMPAPNRKKRGLLRALSKGKLFRSLSFR